MAHPKRKHSKTRRDTKRAQTKLATPGSSVCPSCKQPKPAHKICPQCGEYKGIKYVVKKEKKVKN